MSLFDSFVTDNAGFMHFDETGKLGGHKLTSGEFDLDGNPWETSYDNPLNWDDHDIDQYSRGMVTRASQIIYAGKPGSPIFDEELCWMFNDKDRNVLSFKNMISLADPHSNFEEYRLRLFFEVMPGKKIVDAHAVLKKNFGSLMPSLKVLRGMYIDFTSVDLTPNELLSNFS
tara:strand:+ start:648 stop:1163 length:516 start_codon:yes stop_codon:yes gene_type:complete